MTKSLVAVTKGLPYDFCSWCLRGAWWWLAGLLVVGGAATGFTPWLPAHCSPLTARRWQTLTAIATLDALIHSSALHTAAKAGGVRGFRTALVVAPATVTKKCLGSICTLMQCDDAYM